MSNCIHMYNTFNPKLTLAEQLPNYPGVLNNLDIPFAPPINSRSIGARNIFSHPELRLSIFHIPHKKTMKLHNHPKMHVLTYILHGNMLASLFNPHPLQPSLYTKNVKLLEKGAKHITDVCKDNFHEFKS